MTPHSPDSDSVDTEPPTATGAPTVTGPPPTVRFTDGLLAAIDADLGYVAPERGGALLKIGSLTHLFVSDTYGEYSAASWDISAELSTVVGALEAAGHGTLAGTVHSHPPSMADPSSTDVRTTAIALDINPHLSSLIIAVVTVGIPREYDVAISSTHRMSVHLLTRTTSERPELIRARVTVVPLCDDLRQARLAITSRTTVDEWLACPTATEERPRPPPSLPEILTVAGREKLVVPVPAGDTRGLLIDDLYPAIGPLAIVADVNSTMGSIALTPLPSSWDQAMPSGGQLARMARTTAGRAVAGSLDRVAPLVGSLATKTAIVVGCGSVGSRIAEDLVRAGLGTLTIVDPDIVEPPNLARTVYVADDIGLDKTTALARHLSEINPALRVVPLMSAISELDWGELLTGADLVVAATDDMQQQAALNHHAYAALIPLVACAVYRRAAAGEVILSVPAARSACWSCTVGAGTDSAARRPPTDYGLGGRLAGEAALGPAISLITAAASQIAIGLLAGPSTPAGEPVVQLLREGRTLGIISTAPAWDFFSTLFEGMAHQHAPQSVWAVVNPRDECPVCGSHQQDPPTRENGRQFAATLAALVEQEERDLRPMSDNGSLPRRTGATLNDCFWVAQFLIAILLLRRMWAVVRSR